MELKAFLFLLFVSSTKPNVTATVSKDFVHGGGYLQSSSGTIKTVVVDIRYLGSDTAVHSIAKVQYIEEGRKSFLAGSIPLGLCTMTMLYSHGTVLHSRVVCAENIPAVPHRRNENREEDNIMFSFFSARFTNFQIRYTTVGDIAKRLKKRHNRRGV